MASAAAFASALAYARRASSNVLASLAIFDVAAASAAPAALLLIKLISLGWPVSSILMTRPEFSKNIVFQWYEAQLAKL